MAEREATWPMRPVGELLKRVRRPVDVRSDATYREIGIRSHCKGIFHKHPTTGRQIGDKRVFWVEPGCLILNIVFAWEHAVALTTETEADMIASHRFPMYASRNGRLIPEYAWRYFSSPRGKYDLGVASPGGAGRNKTLGQAEFEQLRIPVPPLSYQRMAIEVLGAVDRAIERMLDLIAAKRELNRGLAQRLLTTKSRLSGFTGRWEKRRIGSFSQVHKGAGVSKVDLQPRGLPAIRYAELYTTHDVCIERMQSFIGRKAAEQSRKITYGDILVAGSGETIDEIGKAAAYLGSEPAYAGGDTIIVSPRNMCSLFLAYVLNSMEIRRELRRLGQGQSVVHVYMRDIASLEVPVPTVAEQERIAKVLSTADREVALLEKRLAAVQELKSGLMQKLLSGHVRARPG